jgi:excinuclease UvrABC nuclease subunit
MQQASQNWDFKKAANLRDRILELEALNLEQDLSMT